MNILIPVLNKNFELYPQLEKLHEEVSEVEEAVANIHDGELIDKEKICYEELASEVLDVIQVSVGLLDNIERKYRGTVEVAAQKHPAKLIDRGFGFKRIYRVEED